MSKYIAALESATDGYMSQLQAGTGACDPAGVFRGLQAATESAQAQVIAYAFYI